MSQHGPSEKTSLLDTHNVGISLPRNTRYLLRNPVSRLLTRQFMATLVEFVEEVCPLTILDVGCGEGMVLRQLQALEDSFVSDGLDIDGELLRVGQTVAPGARYFQGSIYQLPLSDSSYDLLICTEVLEHVQIPRKALIELGRVAHRYCLFSVPHEPWWRAANMARGKYLSSWGNTPGHINHWTAGEFVRFVEEHFQIANVRSSFPWTFVLGTPR